jgi:hypothetical protein
MTPLEIKQRAHEDFRFFTWLCIPKIATAALPELYVDMWKLTAFPELRGEALKEQKREIDQEVLNVIARQLGLEEEEEVSSGDFGDDEEGIFKLALGLPRGFAKTTFAKLLITWLILYERCVFPLIVCANDELAQIIVRDVWKLLSSPNLAAVYGKIDKVEKDAADMKQWQWRGKSLNMKGAGWQAGIRGTNADFGRPDFILGDDVQTSKNDKSDTERASLLKELTGTIFKALAPTGFRTILYLGNMYSENCVLNTFRLHPQWLSIVTGAILADGKPLFPELFSLRALVTSFIHDFLLGEGDTWLAEVMNDPRGGKRTLLSKPFPKPPLPMDFEIVSHDGGVIILDPAGFKKSSDKNAVIVAKRYDGDIYLTDFLLADIFTDINNPRKLLRKLVELAIENEIGLILLEDVGTQSNLACFLEEEIELMGMTGIILVDFVSPKGRSKEARILTSVEDLAQGIMFFLSSSLRMRWFAQAVGYKLGTKLNVDDLLDVTAYVPEAFSMHAEKIGRWGGGREILVDSKVDMEDNSTI